MSYSRLATRFRDLIGNPATPQDTAALRAQLRQTYQAAPDSVSRAIESAAPQFGVKIITVDSPRNPGEMHPDGRLLIGSKVSKSRPSVISHELGHWEMQHRNGNRPTWQKEIEAEAISHDVMSRMAPHLADQYTDYSAAYLANQQWQPKVDPIEFLNSRLSELRPVSDRIIKVAERTPDGYWQGSQMMGAGYRDW